MFVQLHEVMEQQTVSVAKAGIIATLNARTSVLASANPVGSRYNPRLSVIDNIHLPPSLLSRFDLIYLVLDKAQEASDRKLARHLVSLYYAEQLPSAQVMLNSVTPPPRVFFIAHNLGVSALCGPSRLSLSIQSSHIHPPPLTHTHTPDHLAPLYCVVQLHSVLVILHPVAPSSHHGPFP